MTTEAELRQVFTNFSDERWWYLLLNYLRVGDNPLSFSEQLILGIFDWLAHLRFIDDNIQTYIVTWLRVNIHDFICEIKENDRMPTALLTISDERYVTFTDKQVYFDMLNFATIKELPCSTLTLIVCDITVLHLRIQACLQQFYKNKNL